LPEHRRDGGEDELRGLEALAHEELRRVGMG